MKTAVELATERDLVAAFTCPDDSILIAEVGRLHRATAAIAAAKRQPAYRELTRRQAEACRAMDWTTAYRLDSQRCELVRRQLRAGPANQAAAARPGSLAARSRWIQQQADSLARQQWLDRLAGQ